MPIEGGAPLKSFDLLPTTIGSPEWSADGKSVSMGDTRTGTTNLWSFPLDGSPMKQLTDVKPDEFINREWSVDHKSMVITRGGLPATWF